MQSSATALRHYVSEHPDQAAGVIAAATLLLVSAMFALIYARQMDRENAQLRVANEAENNFLTRMGHDIRTPMNAIIGYTDLLEIYGDDVEKREDYLGKIKSSSEYLLSLLNDVLEMARIESGKYIMDETVTDIREFDRSICDVFENQLEQKGIRSVFL